LRYDVLLNECAQKISAILISKKGKYKEYVNLEKLIYIVNKSQAPNSKKTNTQNDSNKEVYIKKQRNK
jgi:hypothetical protein